jgi:hypothetical protein
VFAGQEEVAAALALLLEDLDAPLLVEPPLEEDEDDDEDEEDEESAEDAPEEDVDADFFVSGLVSVAAPLVFSAFAVAARESLR